MTILARRVNPSLTIDRLENGTGMFRVKTALAEATFSLFGGQVLTWQPDGTQVPVLWLSPLAVLDGSKAIRGGAPVCWPWFGAHPASNTLPSHGLARLAVWQLAGIHAFADGNIELTMTMPPAPPGSAGDGSGASLRLTQTVRIGRLLSIELETRNVGDVPVRYSEGLHTYFTVGDIGAVRVEGLDGCDYVDLTAGDVRRSQVGDIVFRSETAKLFVDTVHACDLVDDALGRRIRVEKSGSRSTAIWNPGENVASRMADLGAAGSRTMLCVETANALDDAIVLAPGMSHRMAARYSLVPFD